MMKRYMVEKKGERSPSSRRAWIEINQIPTDSKTGCVALLAEGVDRNPSSGQRGRRVAGRPPRGGRG